MVHFSSEHVRPHPASVTFSLGILDVSSYMHYDYFACSEILNLDDANGRLIHQHDQVTVASGNAAR